MFVKIGSVFAIQALNGSIVIRPFSNWNAAFIKGEYFLHTYLLLSLMIFLLISLKLKLVAM